MRVVLFGRGGKVGQVLAPALEAAGHHLVVELGEAEAMVDFTTPGAVEANVRAALEAGVPCVVGTSGWDPAALGGQAASRGLPLFVAPNFALGAVVMMRLAAEAARFLPRAEIVELHNEAKKDAPSGTAVMLHTAMQAAGYKRPIDLSSTRAGAIPGTHTVGFDGLADTVTLTHEVRDRAVFAHGALQAAKWLRGRRGWFSMKDLIQPGR